MTSSLEWFLIICVIIVNVTIAFGLLSIIFGGGFSAPFVPTGRKTAQKMIDAAKIQKGDTVFDLGCGDGRLVFLAESAGAEKSIGVEISPLVWLLARIRQFFHKTQYSQIRLGNIFSQKDIVEADVVFCFLLPDSMKMVFDEIWPNLKKGTRLVSHAFRPKGIDIPHEVIKSDSKEHGTVHVYVKG